MMRDSEDSGGILIRRDPSPTKTEWQQRFGVVSILIAVLVMIGAARAFFICGALPFYAVSDEQAHVDNVMKYARWHWPESGVLSADDVTLREIAILTSTFYLTKEADLGRDPWLVAPPRKRRQLIGLVQDLKMSFENHEAGSPPVYYLMAAGWHHAGRWLGVTEAYRLYWLRFMGVPFLAGLILASALLARMISPSSVVLRVGVPLLVAFFPQPIQFTINSDVASPLFCTVSLLLLLKWWRSSAPSWRLGVSVGLMVSLAVLVKLTNAPLVCVVVLAVVHRCWQLSSSDNRWTRMMSLTLPVLIALTLPLAAWLTRNALLIGDLTATAQKIAALTWTVKPWMSRLSHPIFSAEGVWTFWRSMIEHFWRDANLHHRKIMALPWSDAIYVATTTMLLPTAMLSILRAGLRARRSPLEVSSSDANGWNMAMAAMALCFGLSVLQLAYLSTVFDFGSCFGPSRERPYFIEGRLIIGSMVPMLVLWVRGVEVLFSFGPLGRTRLAVAGPLAVCLAMAVVVQVSEWTLIWPAFEHPYNWWHME